MSDLHEALLELERSWRELLGVEHAKLEDDFFELGGDSLLAIELIDRLERHVPTPFPVDALFADGTLGSIRNAYRLLLGA